ncbi:hypothetical protein CNR22_23610 [Sphingobacteriaceae bacterium]|nr:hypothetical protein CNR22_23610 [Sphingobacteriaceae bacterium]
MKKIRFIFVFVFLAGMLFTVFQYIPILEEEPHGHKVELAKKVKADSSADGDDDKDADSDDDDSEQELNYFFLSEYASLYSNHSIHFSHRNNLYSYLLESKDTPPPKI